MPRSCLYIFIFLLHVKSLVKVKLARSLETLFQLQQVITTEQYNIKGNVQ